MERDVLVNNLIAKGQKAMDQYYMESLYFLNLQEQLWVKEVRNRIPSEMTLFGGYEDAERKIPLFYPDESALEPSLVVGLIKIEPTHIKFSDQLSHRDYLGALVNLGIKRETLGDIIEVNGTAYVYVTKKMMPFIMEQLFKVKHTEVVVSQVSLDTTFDVSNHYEPRTFTVASLRLDAVLAHSFHLSRTQSGKFIESEKAFINHKLITSLSYPVKEGDIISLRGVGKIRVVKILGESKKGRTILEILFYK